MGGASACEHRARVEKKKIAGASIVVLALLGLGLIVRKIDAPTSNAESNGAPSASSGSSEAPAATSQSATTNGWDGAALAATIHDAKVREEVRRRIIEA